MTKTQQSSRRTKHIDIKYFSIIQWTEDELITFQQTKSEYNFADNLRKITGKCKFHQHADIFMGRRPPQYIIKTVSKTTRQQQNTKETIYIPHILFSTCIKLHQLNFTECIEYIF